MEDRLRSLVADEVGECCDEDVEEKRDGLEKLRRTVEESFDPTDVRVLSVLGDETRYRIVRALAESEKEMCVCEFDLVLDVSESAVSHAFRELYDKGLVQREKRGRWRYYETTDRAEAILDALEGSG